ncbi:MAG TPA: hypothetical protein VG346_15760 [Acidimicrobiales bacterium]|nr:hypothetical protein [Acidimicrobiales bacterium]
MPGDGSGRTLVESGLMASPPKRLRSRVDAWARLIAEENSARVAEHVTVRVEAAVRDEMTELARMLRQQGDAADELAETFGRSLIRLSKAIEDLQARLDRLEMEEGRPTRSL